MRAITKLTLMVLFLLAILIPTAGVAIFCRELTRQRLVQWVFIILSRLINIHITRLGALAENRPLLVVANHCSYADILVLGAACPVSFSPKSGIKYWPLIGWCAMLAGSVFVERKASSLPATRTQMHRAMHKGRILCLFPEGTTNDGTHMKPFKSGFFSLAEQEADLQVQPITLRYVSRNNQPLDEAGRTQIAWFGTISLIPHLLRFLSFHSVDVEVIFHPPINAAAFDSRKELCRHCEDVIKKDLGFGI